MLHHVNTAYELHTSVKYTCVTRGACMNK